MQPEKRKKHISSVQPNVCALGGVVFVDPGCALVHKHLPPSRGSKSLRTFPSCRNCNFFNNFSEDICLHFQLFHSIALNKSGIFWEGVVCEDNTFADVIENAVAVFLVVDPLSDVDAGEWSRSTHSETALFQHSMSVLPAVLEVSLVHISVGVSAAVRFSTHQSQFQGSQALVLNIFQRLISNTGQIVSEPIK